MTDLRATLFLPQTDFPMKANLTQREPILLERWETMDLYGQVRQRKQGLPRYVLHSGPPYANGHLHMGHAFNMTLKDVVIRMRHLLGYDAPFVVGWDCHGLPIEWKIEEQLRASGKRKEEVDPATFRQACRDFADQWIGIQRDEFKRLGLLADWKNPYITMDYSAEAATLRELYTFVDKDLVYRGLRPVMWSVVEKTALAEAEVEYMDRTSPSIYVRFPVVSSPRASLQGAEVVIWTTTPWSLPGNRAIAYGDDITYVVADIKAVAEDSLVSPGTRLLLAQELCAQVCAAAKIEDYAVLETLSGQDLQGTIAQHPFHGLGYEYEVPLLPGSHVSVEAGTGLVHTAPSHGMEDFELSKTFNLEVPETVLEDGSYAPWVPLFAGEQVLKVNPKVIEQLISCDRLLASSTLQHSYPHSWRSKAPLIYRATPQWFIALDRGGLREKCLEQIDQVKWYPASGRNRIYGMVEQRPLWCISRQRAWGVPIALFVHKTTREILKDDRVRARILDAFEKEGADAWFSSDAARFLSPQYNPDDYEQVRDILDVWFDSGSTQGFVLELRADQGLPADLYLEGSDQHRGWFQSSLLVGCGTRGKAPYKSVMTHGYVLDEQGHKFSKSLGNGIAPEEVIKDMGADGLRLWTVSLDYTDDLRVGRQILKHQGDIYRRYRNTLRYLLGALADWRDEERIEPTQMPELEQWILHRLYQLRQKLVVAAENHDYPGFYSDLHAFCASDLSAYYFDIRKDSLYCDDRNSPLRRAVRTVMHELFEALVRMLAPVLCFTAEEAWIIRHGDEGSVHFETLSAFPETWHQPHLDEKMTRLRTQRRVMTGALEAARASGLIGSSLQAHVTVYDPQKQLMQDVDYAELVIVSQLTIVQEMPQEELYSLAEVSDLWVKVGLAEGDKCQRCWKVLPEVGHQHHPDVCQRCDDAVQQHLGPHT
ncbi:MAG: isoleucine--tRNA ligase [Holosporales bacterium]